MIEYEYEKQHSNGTGKAVAATLAKKALKSKLFWPLALALGVLVLIIIAGSLFIMIFLGTDQKAQYGWMGGTISPLGEKEIPAEFIPIYKAAAEKYGVPWNLLAAHHKVETGFSSHPTMTSSVGAVGHMQFMKLTWLGWGYGGTALGDSNVPEHVLTDPAMIKKYGGYGVDANGDGKASPWDLEDSIHSAAKYLAANGAAEGDLRRAVFAYNHSQEYVNKVLGYADQYVTGYIAVSVTPKMIDGAVWPVPSTLMVTSHYGGRVHPITGEYHGHTGMDIAGPGVNGKPIVAYSDGVVKLSSFYGGYGNCVIIDHGNGLSTLYGHMLNKGIPVGTKVKAGDTVGQVGSTGNSTGPHLHFEIIINGSPTDPSKYLSKFKYKNI